jgi:CRISPR-associated protein Csy1
VQSLRRFLASDPTNNKATREVRNQIVESILDELIQFAAELHTLEAGWSKAIKCDLPASHRQWLDPLGWGELADEEALEQIARDFANWLNAQLRDPLPMGDPEYFYWRKLAREALGQVEREVA